MLKNKWIRLILFTAAFISSAIWIMPARTIIITADAGLQVKSPIDEWTAASEKYGISRQLLIAVAKCESTMRHDGVWGDGGLAYGIMQFHESTFNEFKKRAGLPDLQWKNRADQIELATWAFAHGLADHWTCYHQTRL